jgi:HipA-like protein
MKHKLFSWFNKNNDALEEQIVQPNNQSAKFILSFDNINIGSLSWKDDVWYFKYADEFKNHSSEYNRIVGFPDLDKTYQSEILWPFFQVRIPGLKQPAIREILLKEKIDKSNEVALLKRFGRKTIANPYELVMA